jgi:hypothetical protein
MQADDGNFSGDVGGENIAARATLGIGDARIRWLVGDPSVVGLAAPPGSLALRVDTPYGLFQKTGSADTAWTALGGGGGGGNDPAAGASALLDFFTADGATLNANGGTVAIVTGTTIGGSPMLGVCQLVVDGPLEEVTVVASAGLPIAVIDDQLVGPYTVQIRLHTTDPQTDPVNQSTVRLGGNFDTLTPMFIAANLTFANPNWHCHSSLGNFDTGIPVDTVAPHTFEIDVDPVAVLTTWKIDGVVVHTAAVADAGRFLPFVDMTADGGVPDNTVSVDWISWSMKVTRG